MSEEEKRRRREEQEVLRARQVHGVAGVKRLHVHVFYALGPVQATPPPLLPSSPSSMAYKDRKAK